MCSVQAVASPHGLDIAWGGKDSSTSRRDGIGRLEGYGKCRDTGVCGLVVVVAVVVGVQEDYNNSTPKSMS